MVVDGREVRPWLDIDSDAVIDADDDDDEDKLDDESGKEEEEGKAEGEDGGEEVVEDEEGWLGRPLGVETVGGFDGGGTKLTKPA
uniref:Uncharacterized protein n=1 Tax=Psilocybe cubensis TaxID=181762 RepID=A0A8H8CQP6_PSICU